jgi:hypothetical protein
MLLDLQLMMSNYAFPFTPFFQLTAKTCHAAEHCSFKKKCNNEFGDEDGCFAFLEHML